MWDGQGGKSDSSGAAPGLAVLDFGLVAGGMGHISLFSGSMLTPCNPSISFGRKGCRAWIAQIGPVYKDAAHVVKESSDGQHRCGYFETVPAGG